jgi:TonB family protein
MRRYVFFLQLLLSLSLGANLLFSQTSGPELKTFDADGLKFSYPAGWTLTNQNQPDFQFRILSQGSSLRMIGIVSSRESLTDWDAFSKHETLIQTRYFDLVKRRLEPVGGSLQTEDVCLNLNGRKLAGKKYTGTYKGEHAIGETYAFGLGSRIVGIFYLRVEKEEAAGNTAWKALLDSISADGTNRKGPSLSLANGGTLNGKALRLVKPRYPSGGWKHTGVVKVEVVIDEQGNVNSATVVSGSPLFHREAIDAAKNSKFPPTLICGEPIKITGFINYSFMP